MHAAAGSDTTSYTLAVVIQSGRSSCLAEQVINMLACALSMIPTGVHETSVACKIGWCLLGWPKPFRA